MPNYTLNQATPVHNNELISTFSYNVQGQLIATTSPDEGGAQFKYRADGQIRYSQNSKQAIAGAFSYTDYDNLGRPVESGVIEGVTFETLDPNAPLPLGNRKEQHITVYDISEKVTIPEHEFIPHFTAGNVAKTYTLNPSTGTTWYSYDIYGRVAWMIQDIDGLGKKTLHYQYDPVSGMITQVKYQYYDASETFIHRYTYNEVDELIKVETSTDDITYTTQADYTYYENGALKRATIAEDLQGIDYVYNLAGQLKSINHPELDSTHDPGGDDDDLFGMVIDYHNGDYRRNPNYIAATSYGTDQWNGNIKGIRWNSDYQSLTDGQHSYRYHYNRNNWLTDAFYGQYHTPENPDAETNITTIAVTTPGYSLHLEAGNSITLLPGFHAQAGSILTAEIVATDGFSEHPDGDYTVSGITYDANGNIQTLTRNKNTEDGSNAMDALEYKYYPDGNRLQRVDDTVTQTTNADDIKDQEGDNYLYNTIGQLIENGEEGVTYHYTASGLVDEIQKNNVPLVRLHYNDRGQRVRKESYAPTNGSLIQTTSYVRDAAGNVMAIYNDNTLTEHTIYGIGRLGIYFRQNDASVYQLTDHLGNVRAVVSKNGNASVLSGATDYYPGGMAMPNRNLKGDYRYGYQGEFAETDPETGKPAFEFRLYDPRINRWLTTDPYGEFVSPYLAMGNNWMNLIDPDGGSTASPNDDYRLNDDGTFTKIADTDFADRVFNADGDFVQLEYDGQIADMQSGVYKGGAYDFLTFKDNFIATEAFEFFANNSSVEFSQVISNTKSFVSTSHKPSIEYGGPGIVNDLLYKGKNVLEFNHSHPYKRERLMRLLLTEMGVEGVKKFTPGPSGFDPNSKKFGKGDALSAKSMLKASPNTKLHVYDATVQEYIQYNQHGAVHKN